jgi:hypothetical protein
MCNISLDLGVDLASYTDAAQICNENPEVGFERLCNMIGILQEDHLAQDQGCQNLGALPAHAGG